MELHGDDLQNGKAAKTQSTFSKSRTQLELELERPGSDSQTLHLNVRPYLATLAAPNTTASVGPQFQH